MDRIHRIRAAEIAQSIAIHPSSIIHFIREKRFPGRTDEKNLSTTIASSIVYYIAITYRRRETPRPRPPRRCQTPRARTRGTALDDRWGSPPAEPRGRRRRGRGAPVRWRSKGCFRRTIAASRSRSRLRRTYRSVVRSLRACVRACDGAVGFFGVKSIRARARRRRRGTRFRKTRRDAVFYRTYRVMDDGGFAS